MLNQLSMMFINLASSFLLEARMQNVIVHLMVHIRPVHITTSAAL
jgi:hypothetical protein